MGITTVRYPQRRMEDFETDADIGRWSFHGLFGIRKSICPERESTGIFFLRCGKGVERGKGCMFSSVDRPGIGP